MGTTASNTKNSNCTRIDRSSNEFNNSGSNITASLGNGLYLSGVLIPEEILSLIISYVDSKTLNVCRRVCQAWNDTADEAFKLKALREYPEIKRLIKGAVPSYVYENIITGNVYDRNLIKNDSGQDGLKYWNIIGNVPNNWKVETPKGLCENVEGQQPEFSPQICFASLVPVCLKEQWIDLYEAGLNPKIISRIQPDITLSELYTSIDCGCDTMCVFYVLKVRLMNVNKEVVNEFHFTADSLCLDSWKKVSHTFSKYGSGVRYVVFGHEGYRRGGHQWGGHYQLKMAEATILVKMFSIFKNLAAEPTRPL